MSNGQRRIEEEQAANICFKILGIKFDLKDKPDLVSEDNNIGIEVVLAFDDDELEFKNLIFKGKEAKEVPNGYSIGCFNVISRKITLDEQYKGKISRIINDRINKKLLKLGGYTQFKKMGLFIFSEITTIKEKEVFYSQFWDRVVGYYDYLFFYLDGMNEVIYYDEEGQHVEKIGGED